MTKKLSVDLKLFCPREDCPYRNDSKNKITKDGFYTTKNDSERRQMLYCCGGKHRYSETSYSGLWGKQGSFKEYEQAAKLFCYGLSADAIADVLGKDVRTITTWLLSMSKKSKLFHETMCLNLTMVLSFIQMDELWSFLNKKKRQLWVFIGFDVDSRFWINFQLGSRTTHNAKKLVTGIKSWLKGSKDTVLKITTDKLAAYQNAIETVLSDVTHVYMQVVKRRKNKRLVTVKKCFVKGSETDFTGKTQNTSYIERFNLTLRQRTSYLCRKTLGFCKKQSNLEAVLWLNLFDYNYRRIHKGLRIALDDATKKKLFTRKWKHRTPGMALGLTNQTLTWRFLFVAPIPLTH